MVGTLPRIRRGSDWCSALLQFGSQTAGIASCPRQKIERFIKLARGRGYLQSGQVHSPAPFPSSYQEDPAPSDWMFARLAAYNKFQLDCVFHGGQRFMPSMLGYLSGQVAQMSVCMFPFPVERCIVQSLLSSPRIKSLNGGPLMMLAICPLCDPRGPRQRSGMTHQSPFRSRIRTGRSSGRDRFPARDPRLQSRA